MRTAERESRKGEGEEKRDADEEIKKRLVAIIRKQKKNNGDERERPLLEKAGLVTLAMRQQVNVGLFLSSL